MLDNILEFKEIINIILASIIGFVPSFFNLKDEQVNNKKKINWIGWSFITISIFFIVFNCFILYQEDKKISQDDIVVQLKLRSLDSSLGYSEIAETVPKEIFIPHIKIGEAETSGIFKYANTNSGKGHAMESKIIKYLCYIHTDKTVENFPTYIEDVNPESIVLYFSLEKFFEKRFYMDGEIKLKIRDKEYTGSYDNRGIVYFSKT